VASDPLGFPLLKKGRGVAWDLDEAVLGGGIAHVDKKPALTRDPASPLGPRRRRRLGNLITFAGPEDSSRAAGLQGTTRNLRIRELAAIVGSLRREVNSGRSMLPETRQVARRMNQNRRENGASAHQAVCDQKALPEACRGIEPEVDDMPCQPWCDQPGKREHGVAKAQHGASLTNRTDFAKQRRAEGIDHRPPPQKPA